MRSLVLAALVVSACDQGRTPGLAAEPHRSPLAPPVLENLVDYEYAGLGVNGPEGLRLSAHLDEGALHIIEIHAGAPGPERIITLPATAVKDIRDLAACVRNEPPGERPNVSDLYSKLTLVSVPTFVIDHAGFMTAPCATKLADRLTDLQKTP